jgi:5-(aminomethyl)-3-furanmethanol phosphate kinase
LTSPVVVKLGGGLLSAAGPDAVRELDTVLTSASHSRPVLVVPGGGVFADAVRATDDQVALAAATAHRLAILAMEAFAFVLSDLLPSATLTRGGRMNAGQFQILLAGQAADDANLPSCWSVTSDSIAVWAAARTGASSVVLLKAVDGLFHNWPDTSHLVSSISATALAHMQAGGGAQIVDGWLPTAVRRYGVEVHLVDGRSPHNVERALRDQTPATRIWVG